MSDDVERLETERTRQADTLRNLADRLEAGEIESLAVATEAPDGDSEQYIWHEDDADLAPLLGQLEVIKAIICQQRIVYV